MALPLLVDLTRKPLRFWFAINALRIAGPG
jgi:hypothetical protein